MQKPYRICVFCGSNIGSGSAYAEAAGKLGTTLAQRSCGLVFGGGRVGLMGKVADAALAAGGEVIGVIPQALVAKELAHRGVTDLRVVGSMHERKALMAELSDAFIALPGGYGALDEFCEILTWVQLGLQRKPCGVLNVEGYYDWLLRFLDHAVEQQFIHPAHREMLIVDDDPSKLPVRLLDAHVPQVDKIMSKTEPK
jgi:uncharacterized protein (TIGR00730 family)